VLVAYNDAPGATRGQLQLVVSESSDGGGTWSEKFRTSSTIRSAQPAVAILANGAIGFLYNSYAPGGPNPNANGTLSQHFVTTTDDFATTKDVTLATASNALPQNQGQPYLGDYVDLTGIGNTFYGWSRAWLDPKFRSWDISEYLAYIRVPVAILQGSDDQYGTIRQIEIAQDECYCPVDVTMILGAGHSPHREAPEATLHAVAEFANRILHVHEGSQGRAA